MICITEHCTLRYNEILTLVAYMCTIFVSLKYLFAIAKPYAQILCKHHCFIVAERILPMLHWIISKSRDGLHKNFSSVTCGPRDQVADSCCNLSQFSDYKN
jgi:hypothetical protein